VYAYVCCCMSVVVVTVTVIVAVAVISYMTGLRVLLQCYNVCIEWMAEYNTVGASQVLDVLEVILVKIIINIYFL